MSLLFPPQHPEGRLTPRVQAVDAMLKALDDSERVQVYNGLKTFDSGSREAYDREQWFARAGGVALGAVATYVILGLVIHRR
jgi:hypothetical protein